jgi:hypothetical protein
MKQGECKVGPALRLAAGAALALLMVVCAGCEDEPSDGGASSYFDNNPYTSSGPVSQSETPAALAITPNSVNARPGQQIRFNATGGRSPFAWSVSTAAAGSVVEQGNERQAIYTHVGNTNTINNVIVTDGAGSAAVADVNIP